MNMFVIHDDFMSENFCDHDGFMSENFCDHDGFMSEYVYIVGCHIDLNVMRDI